MYRCTNIFRLHKNKIFMVYIPLLVWRSSSMKCQLQHKFTGADGIWTQLMLYRMLQVYIFGTVRYLILSPLIHIVHGILILHVLYLIHLITLSYRIDTLFPFILILFFFYTVGLLYFLIFHVLFCVIHLYTVPVGTTIYQNQTFCSAVINN